ncbi:MAG: hypothetical protein A2751_02355 [Candidatus Doudnabacteria bacterium RIFCSPHIGHO2_01_FULL_46_14]|uniref:MBL fold metallo-hydrolase n=1 Tax=Candidatus Doudnabacteria bacterium RIFCSPHIGHO2_01_FULL_46_14 TaxID=1817824 RepID=A0A1F5NJY2_9BACT|nr:MAG: hypothetical protein A2751_02355 [Candidatus Doudnabacteria bacterium RIFCSPHIGHO2_01_FULL_46_14]
MPSITFYGATEEVTGSCYLIRGKKITILVDCGLFQGERFARAKNYESLPFGCGEVDHVLLTHAHVDHAGRLPKICLEGFVGKIYATAPTLELTKYLWQDALEIMDIEYQETGRLPLYAAKDAKNAEKFFKPVEYGKKIFLSDTDYAIFYDAGHILGSSFIELVIDGKRIVFSGDIGNVHPPIIRETEKLPENIDLLLCESTYGNRLHEPPGERRRLLEKTVAQTIKQKGVLLIPAFAVERTQEILYEFNRMVNAGLIPTVPIFLDSPLAIKITEVFKKDLGFYNHDDQLIAGEGDHDLFNFPGLRLTQTRLKSKDINSVRPPKIIIAGNGMMNGGRIVYHLERYLPNHNNTLLIIGYQAANTTGRKILEGHKWIPLFTRSIPVRARVQAIGGFSAHADQKKLLSWIGSAKNLKRICLVHGDAENMVAFSATIAKSLKIPTLIPKYGSGVEI